MPTRKLHLRAPDSPAGALIAAGAAAVLAIALLVSALGSGSKDKPKPKANTGAATPLAAAPPARKTTPVATPDKTSDNALAAELGRGYRAVSLPLDNAHGMLGDAKKGDRVDVITSFQLGGSGDPSQAVVKPLESNVLVLASPKDKTESATTSIVTVRMTTRDAAKVAFATDNGKVWVVLRAPHGAGSVNDSLVTLSSVLGSDFLTSKPKQNQNGGGGQ